MTTDVADELHLHGYDLEKETVPGKPATIEFDASIPGEFEAELHHTHLTVVEFEVR
ncbi:MAG: hypothetical protein HOV67_25155 [Kribbellaceae bacterium]|nr:hypothetical protein [Kribbellaceae bacterium]